MSKSYEKVSLQMVVAGLTSPPPCDQTLGISVQTASNGKAHANWQVEESFVNGMGVTMGGFVSSAADITIAYAMASALMEEQRFFSINLQTTFHRPVGVGDAKVQAEIIKMGKKTAYAEAIVFQGGKRAATVTSSLMID